MGNRVFAVLIGASLLVTPFTVSTLEANLEATLVWVPIGAVVSFAILYAALLLHWDDATRKALGPMMSNSLRAIGHIAQAPILVPQRIIRAFRRG